MARRSMKGHYGMVKIGGGPHAGRWGWYDDDDGDRALVWLHEAGAGLTSSRIRERAWISAHLAEREPVRVRYRDLLPFEDEDEEDVAWARMAPAEVVSERNQVIQVVDKVARCLTGWGLGGTDIDRDLVDLDRMLTTARILHLDLVERMGEQVVRPLPVEALPVGEAFEVTILDAAPRVATVRRGRDGQVREVGRRGGPIHEERLYPLSAFPVLAARWSVGRRRQRQTG